jgi:hypothetical protein
VADGSGRVDGSTEKFAPVVVGCRRHGIRASLR